MPTNVLLCDTADEVARLQYHLLRGAPDLAVEVTTDAFRAVEAAARSRPDVIVMELALEGVAGPELVRRLRTSVPGARVVVSSAVEDPALIGQALAAGAAAYVVKEDGASELIRAIRAVADGGGVTLSTAVASLLSEELRRALERSHELESELSHIRESVAKGTSAKADFLSNISHEIRTPVTVAKGIAYLLRNPIVPDDERSEFLDQLQASLDKLMGIVEEIITIAELERGTFELDLIETDLAPLVRHAIDEVSRQYPSVPIDAQVPGVLMAIADASRIGGVVRELIDNGCRYSPHNRAVEVRARVLDEGVVVSVTDRGEGLDRSVAMKAFEQPFSTGEGTLRKEKAGVGVGLHLARQVVLEHGGILWADPLPAGGTRVSFCIPSRMGERLAAPPLDAA